MVEDKESIKKKLGKGFTRFFTREKTKPVNSKKTPEDEVAAMSDSEVRTKYLDSIKKIEKQNTAISDKDAALADLSNQVSQLNESLEQTRSRSMGDFSRVFQEDSKESQSLEKLRIALEHMVADGHIVRDTGFAILRDVKYCLSAAEKYPRFKRDAETWKKENAKLRRNLLEAKQKTDKFRDEAQVYRQAQDLNEVIEWTMELIRRKPELLQLSQATSLFFDAQADAMNPTESQEKTLKAKALFAFLADLVESKKNFFEGLAKASRQGEDAEAKLYLVLDELKKLAPEQISELEEKLKQEDALKAESEKKNKQGTSVRRKGYAAHVSETIPSAVVGMEDYKMLKGMLKAIKKSLDRHFDNELSTRLKTIEGEEEIKEAVIGFIDQKLGQYENIISDFENEIASSKGLAENYAAACYDIIHAATGREPDKERFAKEPVAYARDAVNQLKDSVSTVMQHSSDPKDPVILVKQAYVHQLLGNIHSTEGKDDLARLQYEKARLICDTARAIAPEEEKKNIDEEISRYFVEVAEND
ncbi:hypothetical protein GF351_01410 [Candidatus Woesearchaeota archaeon]|nr:hypothetical protein [Candidatus Woesearchaeota archaeon]